MRLIPSRSARHEIASSARILSELPKLLPLSAWSPARLLERNAKKMEREPALLYEDERFTWGEVNAQANRYARWLSQHGVGARDVVAILMGNRPDFLFLEMGLSKVGAVAALINTNLTGRSLVHTISIGKARLLVVGAEHEESVASVEAELRAAGIERIVVQSERESAGGRFPVINAEVAACAKSDLERPRAAVLLSREPTSYIYTSGTTGLPKAAVIGNQRYVSASALFARVVHDFAPGDVLYVALPLYHSSAQWMGWGACMISGTTMALRPKFSASHFWSDVTTYRATHFLYIGEICRYLLNSPPQPGERAHRLRMGVGNGLRANVWKAFQERFGVPLMRELYGATEGTAVLFNLEGRAGMVGRLWPGQMLIACDPATGEPIRDTAGRCVKVKEGGTGLLVVMCNPLVRFEGYLDASATRQKVLGDVRFRGDAYFSTGDLLTLHEDGWVSFADRAGDTFRWKGENVSTNEVAETLNEVRGVLQSNVYGVEVPGTEGRAGMASLEVGEGFDAGALAAFVSERLPVYQRPYFIRVQQGMNMTATFKQQKGDYREQGYDPSKCGDPLYYLDGKQYVPIDEALFQRLQAGEVGPR